MAKSVNLIAHVGDKEEAGAFHLSNITDRPGLRQECEQMIGDFFADFGPVEIDTSLSEGVVRIAAEAASERFSTPEIHGRRHWRLTTPFAWKGHLKYAQVDGIWDEGKLTLETALPAYADPDETDYNAYMKALAIAAHKLADGVKQRVMTLEEALQTP